MPRSGSVDILFLPLHRWLVANRGTESQWALSIARGATNLGFESLAVVGQADGESVRTLKAAGVGMASLDVTPTRGFLEDSAFYWKLMKTGHRLIQSRAPRILHHVFPFGLPQGFNPLVIARPSCPVVVGPLLYQPTTDRSDEPDTLLTQGIVKRRSSGAHARVLSPILRRLSLATLNRSNVILFDCEETRGAGRSFVPEPPPDTLGDPAGRWGPEGLSDCRPPVSIRVARRCAASDWNSYLPTEAKESSAHARGPRRL